MDHEDIQPINCDNGSGRIKGVGRITMLRSRPPKARGKPWKPNMVDTKLSLKLLIDVSSKKVLFAEAGKDAVDFLFSLLEMPVSAVVMLLAKDRMVGCVASLYQSLECMPNSYLQSEKRKDALLNPVAASSNNLLLPAAATPQRSTIYSCNYCGSSGTYYTDVYGSICPSCSNQMTTLMNYVEPKAPIIDANSKNVEGYVMGVVTYTILDDLTVTPMSTISSITLLNKFQVKDVSALQEKTVKLRFEEGLEMLKVSLQSKTVLTNTFLSKETRA